MSFDQYAQQWDTEKRIRRAKIIADKMRTTFDRAFYNRGMEFGCGTGLISFNLADLFKESFLIDTSEGMIGILKDKRQTYGTNHLIPIKSDILKQEDLIHDNIDIVYSSMVLHHVDNTKDIMTRFYKLLKEKGELCIVDIDLEDGRFHSAYPEFEGHNGFDHKELICIAESVGFKNIEITSFYNDVKVIRGENVDYSLFIMHAYKE